MVRSKSYSAQTIISIFIFSSWQFYHTHSSNLDIERFLYLEKLFYLTLELKLIQIAKKILAEFFEFFGKEAKIRRMEAQFAEIEDTQRAHEYYKRIIISNQEDIVSAKRYIGLIKSSFSIAQEDWIFEIPFGLSWSLVRVEWHLLTGM